VALILAGGVLLGGALLLGVAWVGSLRVALYPFEAVALTVVIGLFGWSWLVLLSALVLPYAFAVPLSVGLGTAAGLAVWLRRLRSPPRWRRLEGGWRDWALWGATTALTTALLVPLFWTHSLVRDPSGMYSAGATWGDLGLHASLISHFAAFDRLPLDLPVASGARLTYPFLADLLSALYLRAGWCLTLSLFLPGVLLALACCQLILAFGMRLFDHAGAAAAGLVLVLLTGSAAGVSAAYADWRRSGLSLPRFFSVLPRDYTVPGGYNAHVANLVADALLPQRGMLFGLGAGLTVLILLHSAGESGRHRSLPAAGVLTGLLPMAHPHTFIVCATMLGALTVQAALRLHRPPWAQLTAAGLALLLAAPQLAWQQLANATGTGGRLRLGWMQRPGESIWAFWWANFGLMGIFFLVVPLVLLARRDWRRYLVWYLPVLGILAATQVYAVQPFEYDNVKLIYYTYLMASLLAGFLAMHACRASRWSLLLIVPVALIVALPGALSLAREFQLRDQFASNADLALAAWVRAATAPGAVFIGPERPNHPVAALGGRSLVLGYRGWLFNFNIPYAQREAAVRAALRGRVDDPNVCRFAPDYLVVGRTESGEWVIDRASLARLPVAYQNPEWTVYRLIAPPDQPAQCHPRP
jgi:hypothetical protein